NCRFSGQIRCCFGMPTVITELSLGAIECRLQYCQGRLVLWANDLAEIYNISPAKLLECMRRHGPFPGELAFWADAVEVGAFQDDDQEGGPHQVFTEHGALVMAYLIGTDVAIARSIRVLQAF